MRSNDQRAIIEELLGITLLSEKAENLKEQIKFSKDEIQQETTRIDAVRASNERIQQSIDSLERKQRLWEENKAQALEDIAKSISVLDHIDIDAEIANQKALAEWREHKREKDQLGKTVARMNTQIENDQRHLAKLQTELEKLAEHKCHSCGQDIHDEQHETMMTKKADQVAEYQDRVDEQNRELTDYAAALELLGELGDCPSVQYGTLEEALNHRATIDGLEKELENKNTETNPYDDQIRELKESAVQEINWDTVNELTRIKEHQEFLYKLLTNKDSYIRKRIIDQNLAFLNQRLTYYLNKVGLPHLVEFQNDLSVIITQLGQDLDFDNLSRGERNRLILSLSWAFRDVWENLYHSINLLFIDELIDNGLDANGVENSISVLKKMTRERDKNVFLISHRDDLTNRVNQVLKVIKENGFTSYNTDVDIV